MKMVAVCLGVCALALLSGLAVAQSVYLPQDVYKWVDTEGVTHYAAQPPRGTVAERTGVRVRGTNQGSLQARTNVRAAREEVSGTQRQNAAEDTASARDLEVKNADIRRQNCEQAKQAQKTYNEARRLYRTGADGEREYLTADELDTERAAANDLVEEWCD